MATPTAAMKPSDAVAQAELEEELRRAEADFANGHFIDVTIEELDRCIAVGEWPWQHEPSEGRMNPRGSNMEHNEVVAYSVTQEAVHAPQCYEGAHV
jgi:hypothetical protein